MGEYVNPLWNNFAPQHRVENLLLVEQNKVNYRDIRGKSHITVSAKGISNGLSDIPNDGADFGPDTPNTQTSGIQEAINYATDFSTGYATHKVKLLSGVYLTPEGGALVSPIYLYNNTEIEGSGETTLVVFGSSSGFVISGNKAGIYLHDFNINTYGNAINLSQAEISSRNVIRNMNINEITSNTIAVNLDGNEDTYLDNVEIYYNNNPSPTVAPIEWKLINGGCHIAYCFFPNGISLQSLITDIHYTYIGYPFTIYNNTNLSTIEIFGNLVGIPYAIILSQYETYTYPLKLKISGYANSVASSGVTSVIYNPESFPIELDVSGLNFIYPNVTIPLMNSYTNVTVNNFNTNFSTGVYIPSPLTPSIPVSGTAETNSNPYAVKVYINGGALTEIQITINGTAYTVYSNSTASAVYEGFTLPAGASITLTYTTAPTWSWLPE